MPFFKNKFFLPICLAGILAGYGAAEWLMPRYFHPTEETRRLTPQDLITALGFQPAYYRQTPSGNYLAGQFAQNHKDWEKASDFIERVLEKEPDNINLQKHAMVLAMEAGKVSRAVSLAEKVLEAEKTNLLAILFIALDNFSNENYLEAVKTLDSVGDNSIAAFIIPILKLWANTAQGTLDIESLDKNFFYAYHAMLAGNYINKRQDSVIFALKTFDLNETDIRDLEKYADLFAYFGETEKAAEIYSALKAKGFTNDRIEKKLARLSKEEPITDLVKVKQALSPKQGAAIVFLDMAEILLREYSDDSAVIFAQMALHLNPELEEGYMVIGNVLMRHKRYEDAIDHFGQVTQEDLFVSAQQQIADLYAEQGKQKQAIDILMNLYTEKSNIDALIQIGDIYRYKEEYQKSVNTYNQVIDNWDNVPEKYWHVLYARGMSYERLNEFELSEKDLKKALEFRPNHPYLLNYLGYSWADQGINLNESLDMIKKAAQIKPDDGYIADSLGWVYYKMNDFNEAIPHLEKAVELLPYDATINDHLGDAYWRTDRRLEARFQWRRAVNYSQESEAELKTKVEQKLVNGLPGIPEIRTLTGAVEKQIEDSTKPAL